MFPNQIPFSAADPRWQQIPAVAGVFALFAEDSRAEPYVSRTPNLRRRIRRLLEPKPDQTRRLQLAGRVARIEYAPTGSDFEALLRLYEVCNKQSYKSGDGGSVRALSLARGCGTLL